MGKARDVGRLQAASVVILDVVRRKRADEVVARSGRKRRQIEKIEDREEDIGEKYKSARTGEATPSSTKKTPMRTGEGPADAFVGRGPGRRPWLDEGGPGGVGCRGARRTTQPDDAASSRRPKQPTPTADPTAYTAPADAQRTDSKQPDTRQPTPKQPTPQKQAPLFKVGDRVEGDFEGLGEFYAGVIGSINEDGTFLVNYDDGDEEDKSTTRGLRKITAQSPASQKTVAIAEPDIWRADDDHESVSDEPTRPPVVTARPG